MPPLPDVITRNMAKIHRLCREHHVRRLTVFGSAAKGTFDAERSDLDFVVELEWHDDPLERGRRYNGLGKALRTLFGRHVDLLEVTTIRNPYLAAVIEKTQQPLYDVAA